MIGITLVLVVLAVVSALLYSKHRHSYWAARGISTPPYVPFLGHFHKLLSRKHGSWVYNDEIYRKYGSSGMYGIYAFFSPVLMISDPELIKYILVKEFDHFADRRIFKSSNRSDETMNHMLSNVNGDKWKTLRAIITPTFTSGKMRGMFPLVCEKADALVSFSLQETSKKSSVDMKFNFGRFTMDTIASCAFGVECNSLVDENAVFPKKADAFFDFGIMRMLTFVSVLYLPTLSKVLNIKLFPSANFFEQVAQETLAVRRKGQKRGDFLDLLLEAQSTEDNSNQSTEKVLDDITVIAQCILFIIGGYDTTASTLAFASFLLSKHHEKQQRLRQELQEIVKEYDGITYQGIMEAKYLDACLMETLRMYPPAPMHERKCTKSYQVPGTNLTINPGQLVQIPVWSLHHDERYWPEPEVFKPDRFMPENKADITHYTHLPFGMGPRNCVAMRFALMEAKVALAKMVLAAEMKTAPGHEEMKLSPGAGLMRPAEGVHLLLKPLREE